MTSLSRARSHVGGRPLLLLLGSLYTVVGFGYAAVPVFEDVPTEIDLLLAVLVGGPGVVLLVSGYRLPETEIRPEYYSTVAVWCLGAIGGIVGVLGLVEAATDLRDPVQNVLILTALASVAGLAAGRYDARAKSRARDLELRNRELERTKADLEETVERLQTANERLEQFTYAASHDLQEPLRIVSSYLQLLEGRYRDDLDEDGREFIDFAVGGADRMRAMVESLLEYSRVSTSGDPLEPTDAGAVLEGVLDGLREKIDETDATVAVEDLPTVYADEKQLAIVFENLLSNAIRFSGDDPPRVRIGAERADDAWRLSIADEGIGIGPEYHDRVFAVFENLQAGELNSEAGAGGIGLALCERIVERHGGEIWVESEPGEGATFYFTVPAVPDRQTDSSASLAPSS